MVVAPIHLDPTMPDYCVNEVKYEGALALKWGVGSRFRKYFGAKGAHKAGEKVGGARGAWAEEGDFGTQPMAFMHVRNEGAGRCWHL